MKKPIVENIVITTLNQLILEQAETGASNIETDNADSDAGGFLFTPAEERFLGKFDAYGTRHLGIIYSLSDIGIREFITRSSKDLNVTPDILLKLYKQKIIKFVPYTGWGRNDDYTIELQLSLNDVKGLGAADKEKAEKGSQASGAGGMGTGATGGAPPMEVSWIVKYGDVLYESAKIANNLLQNTLSEAKKSDIEVFVDKSRTLRQFPKEFIRDLTRMIAKIDKKMHTSSQKERLIADILDNLQVNLKLTPKQVKQSYEFHKDQKRLNKYLEKRK